ncbi:condensation domain-containing protein [Streptomyces sp. NPDC050856]|uniref:condensation domain-containing protein n=1 Tax=Streptomyces sp. NPDC050856 TaxID=3154939 RepID=UPI0033E69579
MGRDEVYAEQEPSWAQRHRLGQMAVDAAAGTYRSSHPSTTLRVSGPLDVPALERAWYRLQSAHHVLRCGFDPESRRWRLDRPAAPAGLHLVRAPSGPPGAAGPAGEEAARLLAELEDAPFDLEHGPLARLVLVESGTDHLFALVTDHLVSDLWSLHVLMRDLTAFYRLELGLPADPPAGASLPFPEHVRRQNAHLESEAGRATVDRLAHSLRHVGPIPELRYEGFTGAATAGYDDPGLLRTRIPRDLADALAAGARASRMSKWAWIHAAVHHALHTLGDQPAVGTTMVTANREAAAVRRTVGFLSGRVVVATERTAAGDPRTFLDHFNRAAMRAIDVSASVPWGRIIARMRPESFGAPSSVPYLSFNPQPASMNRLLDDSGFAHCESRPLALPGFTLDAAVAVLPVEGPDGISVTVHHRTDWYPERAVERLWERVEGTLRDWVRALGAERP